MPPTYGDSYDFYSDVVRRVAINRCVAINRAAMRNFHRCVEMLGFFPTFVVWSAVGVNDEEAMIALKFNVVQLLALG